MKTDFKFYNLCGTVFKQGNLLFTPDGNTVLSPVGNRVSTFDLVNNQSKTLSFENKKNITRIALSPNGQLLFSVDEDGVGLLVSYQRGIILNRIGFKTNVRDIQFSPNGRFFAVTHKNIIQIWKAPGHFREFAPFVLFKELSGHSAEVTSITWSPDSQYLLTCSKDMSTRLYGLIPNKKFIPITLSGHKSEPVQAFFSKDQKSIYTISRDGAVFQWSQKISQNEECSQSFVKWRVEKRHYFSNENSKVVCCTYHINNNLLLVGFSSGIFGLWEMPDFCNIQTLSISHKRVDSVVMNPSGEWLALGCSSLGQLLVWEWQSESYILKQQGHYYDMNAVEYSPDGQYIATGADDGKLKVWNTFSGYCFITFTEHKAGISHVQFAKNGQIVFSASLDGTVRAFDMNRYRCFRTFTSPSPVQFSSLAVDPSGDIVCAGSMDTFEIFVWSVQTGKILDILKGHEGPISSLAFSPTDPYLLSGSWDCTVRVWDVFGRGNQVDVLQNESEVLAIAMRPDGKEVAASSLKGQISFWNVKDAVMTSSIEGRYDLASGRRVADRVTAAHSAVGRSFNSICYTTDGNSILAGGNSKFVCIYDVPSSVLLKRFQISQNNSLDGMKEFLNSKNMTEAGPKDLIDDQSEDELDRSDRRDRSLPGAVKGDMSSRKAMPEIRTKAVRFAPNGRSWAAAATEGLLIYSLDDGVHFDPYDLEMDITPASIFQTLQNQDYLKSLVMAFRLNELFVIERVYHGIPPMDIPYVVKELPSKYLEKLIKFVGSRIEVSKHLEFHLVWASQLLKYHTTYMKQYSSKLASALRSLRKGVVLLQEQLSPICDSNLYLTQYFLKANCFFTKEE